MNIYYQVQHHLRFMRTDPPISESTSVQYRVGSNTTYTSCTRNRRSRGPARAPVRLDSLREGEKEEKEENARRREEGGGEKTRREKPSLIYEHDHV